VKNFDKFTKILLKNSSHALLVGKNNLPPPIIIIAVILKFCPLIKPIPSLLWKG
jgi:hypothetical protein